MNVFPIENLEDVIEEMKRRLQEKERVFGSIYIESRYNPSSKAIIAKAHFSVSGKNGIYLRLEPQFNYYNFTWESELREKKLELIRLNVKDICYRAIERYLERYVER